MDIEDHLFKNIKFLKSPNFNERPNEENISLIVIHCISLPPKKYGTDYVEKFFLNELCISDHEYFNKIKDLKVSPHLYIKRDGEKDCNDFSIGIELEGSVDDIYENEQYESLVMVTKALIEQYDLINKERIAAHSEIAPERKTDPGEYFDWKKYLKNV